MSARRARAAATPRAAPRLVFDSGGLSGLVGRSQRARAWFRWVVEHDGVLVVPTPVLVETVTGDGARDAEINRVLSVLERAGSVYRAPDEATARHGGRLRHRARTDDGIDALVAAAAAASGAPTVLLTSDPLDMARLLELEPQVEVRAV